MERKMTRCRTQTHTSLVCTRDVIKVVTIFKHTRDELSVQSVDVAGAPRENPLEKSNMATVFRHDDCNVGTVHGFVAGQGWKRCKNCVTIMELS